MLVMSAPSPRDNRGVPSTLCLRACSIKEARRFVGEHHRHSRPPAGGGFAVAVESDGEIVAVGIAGRPVARLLDDGTTIEVTRCCTNGTHNAASMIYGALCRAATALGYKRAVTYTLETEGGASLRAANWRKDGETQAQGWDRPSRARPAVDLFGEQRVPPGSKIRWVRDL